MKYVSNVSEFVGIFNKDIQYVFLVLCSSLFLTLFSDSFKIYLIVAILLMGVCYVLTQNLFWSVCTLFLITLQFQVPGKYYTFQLIEEKAINHVLYPQGVTEGFGLIASDIFALVLSYLLLRYTFTDNLNVGKKVPLFSLRNLILFCWLCFFLISFYSSFEYSFYPMFSVFFTLQTLKICVAFFTALRLFEVKQSKMLFLCIAGIILFQGVLSLTQVLGKFSFLESQDFLTSTVENEQFISRAVGSFTYGNALAFILSCLGFIFFTIYWRDNLKKYTWLVYIILVNLLLIIFCSQSRISWFTIGVLFFLFCMIKKQQIIHFIRERRRQKIWFYLVVGLIIVSPILLPRIWKTKYFFDTDGGGQIRKQMIQEGLEVLSISPSLGNGTGTTVAVMWQNIPQGYIQFFPFAIHNAYLQVALETGIIGSFFFFLPLFVLLRTSIAQLLKSFSYELYSIFCLFFIALLYYSLHPLAGRVEMPFLGLMFGTAVSILKSDKK